MAQDYSHELNKEIRSISGGYELDGEGILDMDGREVLYAVGNAVVDSACCGAYGCRFAVVPGYMLEWKYKTDPDGTPLSRVQPLRDELVRKKVEAKLRNTESVAQVIFW